MHLDPTFPTLVAIIAVVLLIGLTLQLMRQPQVIGYLLAGVAIGAFGLTLLTNIDFLPPGWDRLAWYCFCSSSAWRLRLGNSCQYGV